MTAIINMNHIDPVMRNSLAMNSIRTVEELVAEAIAYEDIGNYEAARIRFNEAIQLSPSDPRLYAMRGACLAMQGRFFEAMDDLNRGISLNPDKEVLGSIYLTLAGCHGLIGNEHVALDYLRLSAKLGNEDAKALYDEAKAWGRYNGWHETVYPK